MNLMNMVMIYRTIFFSIIFIGWICTTVRRKPRCSDAPDGPQDPTEKNEETNCVLGWQVRLPRICTLKTVLCFNSGFSTPSNYVQ